MFCGTGRARNAGRGFPEAINDEQAFDLSRKLARRIEDELQYPGQIRITVIRETRCIEFAK